MIATFVPNALCAPQKRHLPPATTRPHQLRPTHAPRKNRTRPRMAAQPAPNANDQVKLQEDAEANYVSPLSTRYASLAMRQTFADITRFRLWRKLWVALARAQTELGLAVTREQVDALADAPDVDIALAQSYERKLRHDVMSHVHALGDQVPTARSIIHLGATSCYVTDNSEVLQMQMALDNLIPSVWKVVHNLSQFARKEANLPILGHTHLQPAQPTTVGKRATMWLQDFLEDARELERVRYGLRLRGVKGTTGTQASFLELFQGDGEKVKLLEQRVAEQFGDMSVWPVTGQTYTRKQDFSVLAVLAGLGQSAAKMANDVRLLQSMKEIEEPFEKSQIGSSAMPYKRNPMRSERISSLARFLQTLLLNPAETACTQWLERSLDDSANRRLSIAQAFLTADAIAQLCMNVTSGLVVYPRVIEKNLQEELPFMATEGILMAAVSKGGDRQELHEAIRTHSMEAGMRVKSEGLSNDLLDRIRNDARFEKVKDRLDDLCDARLFVGRAPQQVAEFLDEVVDPALQARSRLLDGIGSGDVRI